MENIYTPYDQVVFRTPMWKYQLTDELSEEKLLRVLDDLLFNEALWLASPSLHADAIKWKNGTIDKKAAEGLIYALSRYYQRLCTRTTPFGLFAGLKIIQTGDANSANVGDLDFKRTTRLDMEYLCKLIHHIESDKYFRKYFTYKSNESIYDINGKYRYYEYTYDDNHKKYILSSVDKNEYIDLLLTMCSQSGSQYEDLIMVLVNDSIEREEAESYVNELIDNQIIISNIHPVVSSKNALEHLIRELQKSSEIIFTEIISRLKEINEKISILDINKINPIDKYLEIAAILERLEVKFDLSKLFQIDIFKLADNDIQLDKKYANTIVEALQFIAKLSKAGGMPGMDEFIQKFEERYDNKEMPLPLVLDTDIGIGFMDSFENNYDMPLIEEVPVFNIIDPKLEFDKYDSFALKLLMDAQKEKSLNIKIDNALDASKYIDNTLSSDLFDEIATLTTAFSIATIGGEEHILLRYCNTGSINNLLGRFGHLDHKIETMLHNIAAHEMNCNPEYIFADIIHFPEDRVGNVILKPEIFPYQIPFLGKATCSPDHEININDLYISIKRGKVFLRSKKNNKYVIPRLSNAHSYLNNSTLGIYKFLCNLQYQSRLRSIAFTWGMASNFASFFPRVTYKNVIISAATWRVSNGDIKDILENAKYDSVILHDLVNDWKAKQNIPDKFLLSDADHELFVNTNNRLSLLSFLDEIKKRPEFTIKEFLHVADDLVNEDSNCFHQYTHEFQFALNKKTSVPQTMAPQTSHPLPDIPPVRRKFIPGNEVVYFKVYGGNKIIEKIFLQEIYPFIHAKIDENVIEKWHFVRYNDPSFHIRVRLFLTDETYLQTIQKEINSILEPYLLNDTIKDLSFNIFNREVERYGNATIDAAELFFSYDSSCISKVLNTISGNENFETNRWLAALTNTDAILTAAGLNNKSKLEFIKPLRDSFFKEFNGDLSLNRTLSNKYRNSRKLIDAVMPIVPIDTKSELLSAITPFFTERNMAIQPLFSDYIKQNGNDHLLSVMPSYLHMSLNRFFMAKPRKHELMIYDFLQRIYTSLCSNKN